MSTGINKVMLFGNLGAEPELRTSAGGASFLKFNLATTTTWIDKDGTKKDNTQWHRVTVFGKRGEALAKILEKGDRVFVEGRLEHSSYEKDGQKRYSSSVIADDIVLGGRGKSSQNGAYSRPAASAPAALLDEVPF